MKNIRKMGAILGAGAVIFSLAGCADKNGNGQAESPADATNVEGAVKDNLADTANAAGAAVGGAADAVSGAVGGATNAASNAAGAVADGASKMGGAVADGASKMGGAVANAGETAALTAKVKAEIGGNAGLKGTTIDVDTNAGTNTVTLKGTVKSAAQKTMAGAVAKKAAPGYNVNNTLKAGS